MKLENRILKPITSSRKPGSCSRIHYNVQFSIALPVSLIMTYLRNKMMKILGVFYDEGSSSD
ncbi:hypothetical protein AMTR_s00077p00162980 [Amborella trichopoda]|uniref:Uncharacterized protein n=1 Tax=Amborella trichopoda TaxID=13333 RepID=W1P9B6_AMBTC|nr:hypothetical protein AMTR_s00077p00162980 [Amborella trichopoda]